MQLFLFFDVPCIPAAYNILYAGHIHAWRTAVIQFYTSILVCCLVSLSSNPRWWGPPHHQARPVLSNIYFIGTDADMGLNLVSTMVLTAATPDID